MTPNEDRIISEVCGDIAAQTQQDSAEDARLRAEYEATLAWVAQRPMPRAPAMPVATSNNTTAIPLLWYGAVAAAALLLVGLWLGRDGEPAQQPTAPAAQPQTAHSLEWATFEQLDRGSSSLIRPPAALGAGAAETGISALDPFAALRQRASKALEL